MYITMWCIDLLEIGLLTIFFYHIICWLLQDRVSNLIYYFAGYVTLVASAFITPLPTIQALLILYSPVIMILFIILHEKQLQKNFVTAYQSTFKVENKITNDWPALLIQTGLHNFIQQRATLYLIEGEQPLDTLVSSPFIINSPVQKDLLEMICASQSYNQLRALWITKNGILRGINTYWYHGQIAITDLPYADDETIIQSIQPLIENSGALACFSNVITRKWTIIAHDSIFKKISAQHALQLLQKALSRSTQSSRSLYYGQNKNISTERHTD